MATRNRRISATHFSGPGLAAAALLLAVLSLTANADDSARVAVALKLVAKSQPARAFPSAVCPRLTNPCDAKTTQVYLAPPSATTAWYLIDSSKPMLVALDAKSPTDPALARQWDFSAYRHSYVADTTVEPLKIYPALYALGGGRYAIAVLSTLVESYAGGGATYEVADIVALDEHAPTAATPWKIAYATLPFACHKSLRACFSPQERQPCLEQYEGVLLVQGPPEAWHLSWKETHWLPHVKQSQTRRQAFFPPADGRLPVEVSFCGGPQ